MAYTVIRTDLMSGTNQPTDLVSVKVFNSNTPIAVENGTIVELEGLMTGEREVYKGKLATAASDPAKCVIIATPEVHYDERKKNLDEFTNEAGSICRGYALTARSIFGITKDGFAANNIPTDAAPVYLGANGKLTKTATANGSSGNYAAIGSVHAIETAGRYTYYVIKLA